MVKLPDFMSRIDSPEKCQKIANSKENNFLDCLDDCSLACFRRAFVIAQVSGDETVLITGPSGTGKTGYANLIWNENVKNSKKGPARSYLPVNCAAFNDNLILNELFGSKKGAFTGAGQDFKGKIETAADECGCLFLDEIGELSLPAQAALLRFFQDKEIQVLGSPKPKKIDKAVKVICATNKNLEKEVREGRFREDLYNRINKYMVTIPPLRDRPKDFFENAQRFLRKFVEQQDASWAKQLRLSSDFQEKNKRSKYAWPGNFRELENRIHQAVVVQLMNGCLEVPFDALFATAGNSATEEIYSPVSLESFGFPNPFNGASFDLGRCVSDLQRYYVERAKSLAGNKAKAAALLGLSNYQKMDRLLK